MRAEVLFHGGRFPFRRELGKPNGRAGLHHVTGQARLHAIFDDGFCEVVEGAAGQFGKTVRAAERKHLVGRGGLGVKKWEQGAEKQSENPGDCFHGVLNSFHHY